MIKFCILPLTLTVGHQLEGRFLLLYKANATLIGR